MSRSLQSKITEGLLELIGTKKNFTSAENADIFMNKKMNANKKKYIVPLPYTPLFSKFDFMDMPVFYYKNASCKNIIIYLHGGAFVSNPIIMQWRMILDIAKKSNSSIIAPIYPKAPQYTYKDTYPRLLELYKLILQYSADHNIVLLGDSAGGNIALVYAQMLKHNNLPAPKDVILLSPCLDLTLTNPEIKDYEDSDPMLSVGGLFYMYKAWANNEDLSQKILSPINNSLKDIGMLTVLIGTHEILYPDTKRLKELCDQQNTPINFIVGNELNHVYPAHPIPEGKKGREQIAKIILS